MQINMKNSMPNVQHTITTHFALAFNMFTITLHRFGLRHFYIYYTITIYILFTDIPINSRHSSTIFYAFVCVPFFRLVVFNISKGCLHCLLGCLGYFADICTINLSLNFEPVSQLASQSAICMLIRPS